MSLFLCHCIIYIWRVVLVSIEGGFRSPGASGIWFLIGRDWWSLGPKNFCGEILRSWKYVD